MVVAYSFFIKIEEIDALKISLISGNYKRSTQIDEKILKNLERLLRSKILKKCFQCDCRNVMDNLTEPTIYYKSS